MAISQAARKTVALSHETGQRIKKIKKYSCHDKKTNRQTNKIESLNAVQPDSLGSECLLLASG